ncbi:hypothetical protein GOODEAATRI_018619 [Goodea atripinnis]|uniref:Uncharacterized protein n=1 Tax=Goodea atripinnis TaxID=208336 RepID=A0ABV0NZ52_9TELE
MGDPACSDTLQRQRHAHVVSKLKKNSCKLIFNLHLRMRNRQQTLLSHAQEKRKALPHVDDDVAAITAHPGKLSWVAGELVLISSSLRARGGVHPGQVASPSQGNTETQEKQPCTPKGNLERPVNLTVMVLDYERKPEYPERTH